MMSLSFFNQAGCADNAQLCSDSPCSCAPSKADLPSPASFSVEACQGCADVCLQEFGPESLGRIIYLNLTLKQICPEKRVAVAVFLTEVCPGERELPCGTKFFTVPAHHGHGCQDVVLHCIPFIVPENSANAGALCRKRYFNARVLSHYIDTDYVCCAPDVRL